MMGKIFLSLMLIAAAVADDETAELCNQLATQFNYLQGLVPLEVGVTFPHRASQGFINGYAKFRVVSGLSVPNGGCNTQLSDDKLSKLLTIAVNGGTAFIISPTKVLTLNGVVYTLSLSVQESKLGKTVTVSDFRYSYQNIYEDARPVSIAYRTYIDQYVRQSLKKELEHKLNYTFNTDERIEINPDLVKELMQNVYLATAQEF